jgi:glycosyltransferase involved in cell wall biosynthesis
VDQDLPSFSIVLETENLATANIAGLVRSLDSLAAQDPPPTCANEVILVDSGDVPPDLLRQLCQQYPWIKVHEAPLGTGYYQAKMLGAELATGEIVVYYDSDCSYEPQWLKMILMPFSQSAKGHAENSPNEIHSKDIHSKDIHIVAGETTTKGVGIYGTAMAMTYIFPQYSGQRELTPTKQYFLNNVAFRRTVLLNYPIPTKLPLYRGNCAIHAYQLREKGFTIWRQPQARTLHAPPNGWSHFFWRFLLIGHDYYWQKRLLSVDTRTPENLDDPTMNGMKGKLQVFRDRIGKMVKNEPRHGFFLPLAIPVMIASALLIYAGYLITTWKPSYLLQQYNKILGESQA